ncbi:MAG: hypothetical protein UU77_C0048G0003 [candidate division WWE3 bacterium GW2011_GWC1_41_7]|uniref:Uncharacterized protein n=3 Tax=Katanobacteria TaxID=422282 RepID=A0A0G0X353_UNCKA|nr:MAG: hypothetical protein UU72_C0042G0005 [candidate division WWE3 bacterium GW2011_GWB1_41_6]KKS19425.1 MAG: hypothetical protein UU77_C0048G0003 [candidate division WWE3 bacterium GW2011_GWC1_41_7]OGC56744.1 MAG: hypothetical protein A2976_03540 [candidate division WWE3 bacterium RIFCSPLOWO2_01_FULL_41_9]
MIMEKIPAITSTENLDDKELGRPKGDPVEPPEVTEESVTLEIKKTEVTLEILDKLVTELDIAKAQGEKPYRDVQKKIRDAVLNPN